MANRQGKVLVELMHEDGRQDWKIAEIGIWKSSTMKDILRAKSGLVSEYWAVDPWKNGDVDSGLSRKERGITDEEWEGLHLHTCRLMSRWFPQVRVLRMESVRAATLFEDKRFDLVFIDASHKYEFVKKDIEIWLPLVKKGGILSGHDYHSPRHPEVTTAVDEVFGGMVKEAPMRVWFIRV